MQQRARGDWFARCAGGLVFLIGVGVILTVLWLAFQMYQDPTLVRAAPLAKTGPTVMDLGTVAVTIVFRIALLFIGSISGSLIANKGINLYFAALPGGSGRPEGGPPAQL